ncbi:MAG: dicarboxylate/amino acid:cation symporter [Prevotella sp.]|nr:dicarboxylate/amino acid:cation symporter [Prevotella sp.]MBQ8488060.1 dicarboxylate/amino acid:cation symporter [Prevotella sp.]
MKKTLIWIGALAAGTLLGLLNAGAVNAVADTVATVYTRLFQLLAVPTIVLAVVTTLATLGTGRETGRIFRRTLVYTLLTTVCAAAVGAVLYVVISPQAQLLPSTAEEGAAVGAVSFADHILSVIPNNIVRPFLDGNVLSLLLIAFAVGLGLSRLPQTEGKATLLRLLAGLQELLFLLIGWLVWTLPLGIVAFAAQLSAQLSAGVMAESLGKYVLVVLGGNAVQFFVVLPLLLVARGLNPLRVFTAMSPAVLMALFTKSSAATLPVTMDSAEQRLGVRKEVARFVLPICTTINMNGCAAFILVTSLFVMQSGGTPITAGTILLWLVISVVSAVGNAGVPMGCYFLTFSLMSGIGAPVAILGLILPIYTIIDMVETAENVWSDSCVCAMTNHNLREKA